MTEFSDTKRRGEFYMATDVGRSGASAPSGYSAEPEPSCTVSATDAVSIPNARLRWQGGKCRVPMWMMGAPAGFCDDKAFGEQHPKEILYARGYSDRNRPPYCFGPCCPGHGGPKEDEFRFFPDGLTDEGRLMWCCVGPDFENLQESPAGFDGNPITALANYRIALAAAVRSTETRSRLSPQGRQSGPKGNAQTLSGEHS